MILEKEVDVFCLCIDIANTPEILLRILDLGKPVLVEKPIAWKLNDIEKIKQL